jgi:peptidoglycan hydrolase-like protein with peptidoglycan-binding domain
MQRKITFAQKSQYTMKFRSFTAILSFVILISFVPTTPNKANAAEGCGTGQYVISAYYSPVPGQSRYATGTYEGDIRLNGGGVTTASGTKVADAGGAFVAAPPCMPYGTVLQIEGLGAHKVLDRGGAIKGSRLDIWMGYGDTGLKNALTWGKRTVFVTVNGDTSITPSAFNFDIGINELKNYQLVKESDPFKFFRELAYGDTGEDVARLQQLLKDIGFYKLDVNGQFDESTKLALEAFKSTQPEYDNSVNDAQGKFGDTTLENLRVAVVQNREKYLKDSVNRSLGRGSKGEDVKKLQEFLVGLGYLEIVSGIYDSKTVDAVARFQIDEGIIASSVDQGAGYFGPKTQLAFDRVYLSLEKSLYASKPAKQSVLESEKNTVELANINAAEMFTESLTEGSSGEEVYRLQQVLKDLNLLNVDPTGYFGPVTSNAVFKFQQRAGLVASKNDSAAGFVGPSTRNALNKFLETRTKISMNVKDSPSTGVVLLSFEGFKFEKPLTFGVDAPEVAMLQKFLKSKGYLLSALNTDYFGEQTLDALRRFADDHGKKLNEELAFDEELITLVNSQI